MPENRSRVAGRGDDTADIACLEPDWNGPRMCLASGGLSLSPPFCRGFEITLPDGRPGLAELLAYARAGFFPAAAEYYRKELIKLGPPTKSVLLERREIGDDRMYLYAITFGESVYHARLGLAPDGRLSQFSLRPEM